eukprot:scaffold5.g625.t1
MIVAADLERDELHELIAGAEQSGEFGTAGPRNRTPLQHYALDSARARLCIRVLPRRAQEQLFKSFLTGYAELFGAISWTLQQGLVPDTPELLSNWQSEHWNGAAKRFFLERGGSLAAGIRTVVRTAGDLLEDAEGEPEVAAGLPPRCARDSAIQAVAAQLLEEVGAPGDSLCEEGSSGDSSSEEEEEEDQWW